MPNDVTPQPARRLLRYADVSRILAVPVGTLRWHVAEGRLPVIRLGPRSPRFDPDVIDAIARGKRSLW
jgi:hypothetical protein